jgi:ABC-type transport system involved in multi-copper enzyme maturation permease subunit
MTGERSAGRWRGGALGRIWAIALNTFREAARMRVLYGIAILVVGWNLVAIVLGVMSIRENARVAEDFGLAGISLFGSVVAILLGVFLLYNEVQRRTVHAIVSKPIERWEFVLGKYLGMALVLSVLLAVFAAAMVLMLLADQVAITGVVARALVLAWLEILTVAAIAIFFSSFSTPFLSGIFAFAMWLIGRVTPDILVATQSGSAWIRRTARVALEIVPDVHLFSPSGRELDGALVSVHGDFVSWSYVGVASLHGAGWIVGLLALACLLFHRRDFA